MRASDLVSHRCPDTCRPQEHTKQVYRVKGDPQAKLSFNSPKNTQNFCHNCVYRLRLENTMLPVHITTFATDSVRLAFFTFPSVLGRGGVHRGQLTEQ